MIPFRENGTHKASIAAMIFLAIVALLIFGSIYVPTTTPYRSVKVGSAASASDNSSSALYAAATLHERSEADRFPNVVSEAADGGESDVSGDTSESLGSTNAEYSDDDDHDNIWPPLNYEKFVRDGAQVLAYLMASDRDLTAKFESDRVLRPGESLASQFRDQRSLRENGWNNRDATVRLRQDFPSALPIRSALRGLGVSPHARPVGLIEYWKYEHTARWNHRGRQVQPVGSRAQYSFGTNPEEGCLMFGWGRSPRYIINHQPGGRSEIVPPPLSYASDMAFLDWRRSCNTRQTGMTGLKHIFFPAIETIRTQKAIAQTFVNLGRPLQETSPPENFDWSGIPGWRSRLSFAPTSREGRALIGGSIEVETIMWMLLRHRADLGHKTIREIVVFTDPEDPIPLPAIYLELIDVPIAPEAMADDG